MSKTAKNLAVFVVGGLALLVMGIFLFTGSIGNRKIIDTVYTFDYAIIELPDGQIVEGAIRNWKDYEGEQIQVTFENGTTYLVSSLNATLISE